MTAPNVQAFVALVLIVLLLAVLAFALTAGDKDEWHH